MPYGLFVAQTSSLYTTAHFLERASGAEITAATRFVNHFEKCSTCGLAIFGGFCALLDSQDLCSAGRSAAHFVSQHLVYVQGHVYSAIEVGQDREQDTRIELPPTLQCVRFLLKALKRDQFQDLYCQPQQRSTSRSSFFQLYPSLQ